MNFTRERAALLLLVGLVGMAVVYGLLVVDKPRVESVENEWGAVNADRSEVETEIMVDNPLFLRVGDAAASVAYSITLNGVQFASGRKEEVHLGGQNGTVRMSIWMNNDRIPEWWVTHVNDDETSTVTVDPTVRLKYGGVRIPAERWTRERTFHTDLLEPLETDRPRRFAALDRTVLVVNETDARWGHATAERTPIYASATVTNSLPVPLPITDVRYTVRMNGIVVGQGEAATQTLIPAGSTQRLEASAYIDNSKLDEWWVTHLRNNETTRLSVSFDANVEIGGSTGGSRSISSPTIGRSTPTCSSRTPQGISPSPSGLSSPERASYRQQWVSNHGPRRDPLTFVTSPRKRMDRKLASALTTHNLSIVNVFGAPIESARPVTVRQASGCHAPRPPQSRRDWSHAGVLA